MRTVKKILALACAALFLSSAYSAGADIIVLMDASGTILPWFEQVNTSILPDITKKFVREGDTFHLVSFNSRVNMEIVQPIHSEEDISRVVSRFMLLYPLGQNSDFLSGLKYTWNYSSSLDQQKQKIFIVISDGIFNPPPSSVYASYTPEEVKRELNEFARKIRGAGWHVYYIKLPFPDKATIRSLDGTFVVEGTKGTSGAKDAGIDSAADSSAAGDSPGAQQEYLELSSGFTDALKIEPSVLTNQDGSVAFSDSTLAVPEISFPKSMGKKGRYFTLPLKAANPSTVRVNMELNGVYWNGVNVLEKNSFLRLSPGDKGTLKAPLRIPDSVPQGQQTMDLRLTFTDGLRVHPHVGSIDITITNFSVTSFIRAGGALAYAAVLILLAVILIALVFIFVARKTSTQAADTMKGSGVASSHSDSTAKADKPDYASHGHEGTVPRNASPATSNSSSSSRSAQGHSTTTKAYPEGSRPHTDLSSIEEYASANKGPTTLSLRDVKAASQGSNKKIDWETSNDRAESADRSTLAVFERERTERLERYASLSKASDRTHVRASRRGANKSDPIAVQAEGRILLELDVQYQNKAIGKRNIHMMKSGTRLGIGGGSSAFLVFLVKFPSNIAEVRFDGKTCDLAILRPEYFPFEDEVIVKDCVGRTFTIVSDKEYEVSFSFKEYEDPVARLNRFLTSVLY